MKYTLVLQLTGALAKAVAVEWTDLDAPEPDGTGWEPCIRLPDGRWRFASREGSTRLPHLRKPGAFGNIAIRYRLETGGPWSETSADRKEIMIVAEDGGKGGDNGGSEAPRPVLPPVLVSGLLLTGTGKIGSPVIATSGTWTGATDFSFQWCRDRVDIPGATEGKYIPAAEDDLTELACRVTATGLGGEVEVVTTALLVTHIAPTAKGELLDEVFDQDSGVQPVAAAADFTGEALVFSVEGAGATVDPGTGVVSIPTDTPLSGEIVTVTATNSGGAASSRFPVTVEETPGLLVSLEEEEWEIVDLAEDPVHKGMVTAVIRFPAGSPAERAIAAYWSDVSDPAAVPHPTHDLGLDEEGCRRFRLRPAWKDSNNWHVRAPGESKGNIAIRYRLEPLVADTGSHMDHWLEENRPLLSENSVDRKSFSVPADFFGERVETTRPPVHSGTATPTAARSSITFQKGCVATLNRSMQWGQFWDGTWFIVNPSGSSGFSLAGWTPNGGSGEHGVMVNPMGNQNGFESTQRGSSAHHLSYSDSHNRAPNRKGPISFAPGEEGVIIKCISATGSGRNFPNSWRGWHTDQQRHYAVYVLKEVPPAGSIAPAANGHVRSKAPVFTIHDIDWSRIPNLNIKQLPHQDRPHLTLENCITNFLGEEPRGNGNFNGQIHNMFNIRSQSQLARENAYGSLSSYGSYWGQMAQAALVYLFASSTSQADKERLASGLLQFGSQMACTAQVYTSGNFHGQTFAATAIAGLAMVGNRKGKIRDSLLDALHVMFRHEDKYKYVSPEYMAGGSKEVCPLQGRDPRIRRKSATASWPMDFPFLPAHQGMPHYLASWTQTTNADHGAKLDTDKAKQYNMEQMLPFFVALIEGGEDALPDAIILEWIDRTMYWWRGHYEGKWLMGTSDTEEWRKFDADWRVHDSFWRVYRDYRSRLSHPVWKGKPEQPFAPILTKSGSTITVEVGRFRCGNGYPITKGQYRVRQSSSRSSTSGWSTWTDFSVPAEGKTGTFTIPGRPSGANQVQIRYVNSAGAGPESLNIPYRADGAKGPGRQPAGNLAQITI